jgi:hypothetical protein
MVMEDRYYRHSGEIGALGPAYVLVSGTVGTLVLSAVYAYVTFYIPFVYLNGLLTFIFGGLVGLLIGKLAKLGKVRNSAFVLVVGFLFGLIAEYAAWTAWIFAFSHQEALVLSPSALVAVVKLVAEKGPWSMFGWSPTDTALYIIWAIEGAIIIGASALVGWGVLISAVSCERCARWVEDEDTISPLESVAEPDQFRDRLENGDCTCLSALKKVDAGSETFTSIKLLHCPSCEQLHLLTVKAATTVKNSKGEIEHEKSDIVENLIINPEIHEMVRRKM